MSRVRVSISHNMKDINVDGEYFKYQINTFYIKGKGRVTKVIFYDPNPIIMKMETKFWDKIWNKIIGKKSKDIEYKYKKLFSVSANSINEDILDKVAEYKISKRNESIEKIIK